MRNCQLSSEIVDIKSESLQQTPLFANSVEECTNTTKLYVLPDGYIYAYMTVKTAGGTEEVTEQIKTGFTDNTRLSTSTAGTTSALSGFVTSPLIDISEYPDGFTIKLSGAEWCHDGQTNTTGYAHQFVAVDGGTSRCGYTINTDAYNYGYQIACDTSTKEVTITTMSKFKELYKQVRFSGKGTSANAVVEIIYTKETQGGTEEKWANTGLAFVPHANEDRIIAVEEACKENAEAISEFSAEVVTLKTEIVDIKNNGTTIPEGVQTAVSALVDKAMSREGNRVLRFLISSDAHQKNDDALITKGTAELGQAQGEILKLVGVDFVANLGDIAWGAYANTVAEVVEQIKTYKRLTASGIKGEPQLWCEGNHDDGNYSLTTYPDTPKLTASAVNTLIYSENKGVVYDFEHIVDGYCYKDFEHLKVRVICLNTEQGTGDGGVVEDYQLEWLEEVALNMSGKTDWSVITLAHHPFSYGKTSLNAVVEIIDAFINSGGKYIAHFHGHAHAFSVVKMQKNVNGTYTDINAWEICVPNACYSRNNQYLGNANERISRYSTPTTYAKTDEGGKRTSFNLVTVCLDKNIIYADNYGAGIDREISY